MIWLIDKFLCVHNWTAASVAGSASSGTEKLHKILFTCLCSGAARTHLRGFRAYRAVQESALQLQGQQGAKAGGQEGALRGCQGSSQRQATCKKNLARS
jgi:hypothetical protein